MPKFKNLGEAVHLYRPPGELDSLAVDNAQVVDVPGELASETADAYIVGAGDDARAWPTAQWELVQDKTTASTAPAAPVKES